MIRGNHTNCSQFAQAQRLNWLFSKLGSQAGGEGAGMMDVLYCILNDSPEALNMMKEEHIKVSQLTTQRSISIQWHITDKMPRRYSRFCKLFSETSNSVPALHAACCPAAMASQGNLSRSCLARPTIQVILLLSSEY